VQWPADAAGLGFLPQRVCLDERALAINEAEALHLLLDCGDARQRPFDQGDRIGFSALDCRGDPFNRTRIGNETFCGHGASFVLRRPAVSM
jgi:hypothetical protein